VTVQGSGEFVPMGSRKKQSIGCMRLTQSTGISGETRWARE
jgi:hypothetical protein